MYLDTDCEILNTAPMQAVSDARVATEYGGPNFLIIIECSVSGSAQKLWLTILSGVLEEMVDEINQTFEPVERAHLAERNWPAIVEPVSMLLKCAVVLRRKPSEDWMDRFMNIAPTCVQRANEKLQFQKSQELQRIDQLPEGYVYFAAREIGLDMPTRMKPMCFCADADVSEDKWRTFWAVLTWGTPLDQREAPANSPSFRLEVKTRYRYVRRFSPLWMDKTARDRLTAAIQGLNPNSPP